tara:strand:+ start:744 stop:893 length:150 start_codon:yes stop_codon:yes gene_type:complete
MTSVEIFKLFLESGVQLGIGAWFALKVHSLAVDMSAVKEAINNLKERIK